MAAGVSGLALAASTTWPVAAVVAGGLVVAVLFGAFAWALAHGSGPLVPRVAVGVVVGVLLGELAAVVLFGGAVDARLAQRPTPAVEAAAAALAQARADRAGLDEAVARADQRRDDALVVARCEVNPSAQCPQIRITGLPGAGPEARTANDFLGDAQRELDAAVADRDGRAAALDAEVRTREQALTRARDGALSGGLGTRWQAMNGYTLEHPGSLALRLLVLGFFVLLALLPMLLKRWHGATSQEAESAADTAIAVKRAEVRAQVEQLWAEQELNSARMAVAAQNEIDAERQRRRVEEALGRPEPVEVIAEPAAKELEPHRGNPVPIIPDVTRAAARFIRPFVPPVVAGAVDGVTRIVSRPLRQVFEETEEFHFTMRRTHRVTLQTEGGDQPESTTEREWVDVSAPRIESHRGVVLDGSEDFRQIGEADGPRQLPPA
ncbi:DUF4407 domain-containing protein [Mycobacterium sp. AMU20-3851]|uniref:DUF4407 domain-containing protein n=1 Tax=Mycobacterium sp. AMU20-3851 TaxID=3122055 RepID=UPI0037546B6F